VFCHGLQNDPSAVGPVMYPHAPQLFRRPRNFNPATGHFGVTDDPPGVTYWKVKNGIRLTGMPSFEKVLTDQQIWDVSLMLRNAANLPPEVNAALAPMPMAMAMPATPAPVAASTKPAPKR
jgi:thiosulfate dehydrogenase